MSPNGPSPQSPSPIRIRGHILLCFQGFRGLGYSPEFVENMQQILERLQENPQILIQPISGPDQICQSCPNLQLEKHGGCILNGPGTEAKMVKQDKEVLSRLGLLENQPVSWKMVLEKISQHIKGSDLPDICGPCPWLKMGYCEAGIDALR